MRRFFLMISLLSLLSISGIDYTKTEEFKQKIARVEHWRDLVEEVMSEEGYDFDADKIMAIIAAESGGNPYIVSSAGAVGLMQCLPEPWTTTAARLKNPRINIQCGLWVLGNSMRAAEGDWHEALRYYNCGAQLGKEWPLCGARYAGDVLNFWLPYFQRSFNVSGVIIKNSCLEFVLRYDKDYYRACPTWTW